MDDAFDYRQSLLRAVLAFLDSTPESERLGDQIVQSCPRPPAFTLDDIVWGSILSILRDSVFQQDTGYLHYLQRILSGASQELMRGVVNYNFRPYMSEHEWACYEALVAIVALLENFPDKPTPNDIAEYTRLYLHVRENTLHALDSLPPVKRVGDETIYHLALREIGSLMTNFDMNLLATHALSHLAQGFPVVQVYASKHVLDIPNASGAVDWARRALGSLVGQDWIWLTWQISNNVVLFSLH
jgi:hypothetical protein